MKIHCNSSIRKFCAITNVFIYLFIFLGFSKNAFGFSFTNLNYVDINTGYFIGSGQPGKTDAPRWDAVDFTLGTGGVFDAGWSLAGGISYNYESGFLSEFLFDTAVTQVQLDSAIASAFNVWAANSPLYFNKVSTATVHTPEPSGSNVNRVAGAEIDLFASNIGALGLTATFGIKQTDGGNVTLTSGSTNYSSSTIVSSDIQLDTTGPGGNPWSLSVWTMTLTHEIGHAIGLGDVEINPFWDTNAILNDAMTINQLDPNNTAGLALRTGHNFGTTDILMETSGTLLSALSNDDIAGREFLYPTPEPTTMLLFGTGLVGVAGAARRKKKNQA